MAESPVTSFDCDTSTTVEEVKGMTYLQLGVWLLSDSGTTVLFLELRFPKMPGFKYGTFDFREGVTLITLTFLDRLRSLGIPA